MNSRLPDPTGDQDRPVNPTAGETVAPVSDQPGVIGTPGTGAPESGNDADDPVRFDHEGGVPSREKQSPGSGPALATGMFLPVLIVAIVAIVVILYMAL